VHENSADVTKKTPIPIFQCKPHSNVTLTRDVLVFLLNIGAQEQHVAQYGIVYKRFQFRTNCASWRI